MADKFFIATCEKKVSKHPVKDGVTLTLPVKAGTQTEAKDLIRKAVEELDPSFNGKSETYNDWYKVPSLSKVSEEEYNAEVLKLEASTPSVEGSEIKEEVQEELTESKYPALGNDGFFNTKDPAVEESSFIYQSTEDNMQAAKVFVLNVGSKQWAYGFRYLCNGLDKHERMNLDRVTENRGDAIDSSISRLEAFLDYQDEFGDDSHKAFLSAVMAHDFYTDFMEPSERFIEAVASHPNAKECIAKHEDFLEVIESDFADIWPLDKSPEQAIEHINSMQLIDVLYDIEVLKEVLKPYLPVTLTEKTKESMKHIEEVIDKPAANDSLLEDRCFKAALPLSEDLHVVIAIKDCGDEGWCYAHEGSLKTEVVFGDSSAFNEDCVATRKDAIKASAQAITDSLYSYDSSMSLAKKFMKSPYLQDFEENCVEIGVEQDSNEIEFTEIYDAIIERLDKRVSETTAGEPMLCYNTIIPNITDDTDLKLLAQKIVSIPKCNSLFVETLAQTLVERCSKSNQENKSAEKEPANEPKESGNDKPAESKSVESESENESDNAVDTSDSDEPDDSDDIPQNILEKEPANEPIPEPDYDEETKSRRTIWDLVCKTNPRFTKPVEYGERKYTAVDVDHQIEQATNMWGNYGESWGLTEIHETERGQVISAKTTFFYPSPNTGERVSFPLHNSIAFKRVYTSKNGPYESYDDDYFKKLESNFLSRAFAKLGWNADVRQGKFEDAHYMFVGSLQDQAQQKLEQMERENEAFDNAMSKAQVIVDKFNTAKSLAEMKRFKEQALTHLTAIPASNDDIKRKLDTANAKIESKFQEASKQYVDDMASTGESANG
ncbi:hypothetical protein [Vibrio parahaemolyticus]|uniref:hypothetical protein n=1 Tax=Vibrio parahaemolyticus TaxID=670 RepID=UPI0004128F60|nr:hypothetical protein [Vibrio parahaemolyticus]